MVLQLRGTIGMIVDTINSTVQGFRKENRWFFIARLGGTGGLYFRVCCMVNTGIVAVLLPNGRTVHSVFGLEVPLISAKNL